MVEDLAFSLVLTEILKIFEPVLNREKMEGKTIFLLLH